MYTEKNIEENINMLKKKFLEIKGMGYVKSVRKGSTGIGATFESLLDKEIDSLEIPDFGEIEIKTRRGYSKSLISLFNAVPTGSFVYEVKRLRDLYGYRDPKDYALKCLNTEIDAIELVKVGVLYYFKLRIDRNKERLILEVYDKELELIDESTYWDFDVLKEKLLRKLNILALVKAWPTKKDGSEYFNYYKINFYILKDFDDFIKGLEVGIIKVKLKIGNYYDEKRYGMVHSHGVGFSIAEDDLDRIYDYYR